MTASGVHRLEGLEPDNLLAFLALLGVLRALEARDRERGEDERLYPRACWDLDAPPVRPLVVLRGPLSRERLLDGASCGIDSLANTYDFAGRETLDYSRVDSRTILKDAAHASRADERQRIDLLAALMSDGAIKDKDKHETIAPTPLCLLSGQGGQQFLKRLTAVPGQPAPPPKKRAPALSATECLSAALFEPWNRSDDKKISSFRWDPAEDVRYALMAGNPADDNYKTGTQHGANRLAAIGLCALTVVPVIRAGRVRPEVLGGHSSPDGFFFSWPIWREPSSLAGIRALLSHPDLRVPKNLSHLGVDHVMTTHRISVGKYMNFTRARAI